MLVVTTSAAKPLILASWHKDFAATLTSNLDFRLSDFVPITSSVLLLQLITAFVRTSLVAAGLSIEPL